MRHDHAAAVEHPTEPAPSAAEQTANDGLDSISGEADPHAHHRQLMEASTYSRSLHDYQLPDLALVDMQGENIRLLEEVNRGQPVMLNFIFTTCTTICPVLSATFSQVEQQLGEERERVHMISITIDPEYDTPARLQAYAARYDAGPQWQFLTGKLEDIVAIQKTFDAYRGSKMNHEPLTFLRASAQAPWVRLDGLASAADVVREYRQLAAEQDSAP
ncbi:MAG: SCO family protein, partial [Pseudomonadota bacterium]|nr:SCO family protein [Pseudomonadota bacterium]